MRATRDDVRGALIQPHDRTCRANLRFIGWLLPCNCDRDERQAGNVLRAMNRMLTPDSPAEHKFLRIMAGSMEP